MRFFYDSTGKRVGFANGTMLFYYLYNLQGDVIAIVRAATGQIVAKYSYDAWGKCTVTNATGYAVGDKNPFRYRGYYYDTETGLYYLNSRYYNPEFGRFISADGQLSGGNIAGANLYAYCYHRLTRADMVLTGRNAPIPRQAPWKYSKYSLRVFPCLDTFLRGKTASHLPAMDFRAIFGF